MLSSLWRRPYHPSEDDLSAYIDGELSARTAARLLPHLSECEACSGRVAELRGLKTLLSGLPPAALPRSFVLSPEQAGLPLRRAVRPRSSRPAVLTYAPAFVLTLLLAAVAVDLAPVSGQASRSYTTAARSDAPESSGRDEGLRKSLVAPTAAVPPVAPQPAAAGAAAAAEASRQQAVPSPVADALMPAFAEPESASAARPAGGGRSGAETWLRGLEVALAVAFLVSLVAFLQPRMFSKGDL